LGTPDPCIRAIRLQPYSMPVVEEHECPTVQQYSRRACKTTCRRHCRYQGIRM